MNSSERNGIKTGGITGDAGSSGIEADHGFIEGWWGGPAYIPTR